MNRKERHIILAIDPTSQEAEHTVQWAISNILDSNRDQVDLVCALYLDADFTDDVVSDVPAMYDYHYLSDIENQLETKTSYAMKRFESMLLDSQINVRMKVYKAIASEPRNILVEYTQSSKADILIMGSRNLSAWKRFFWGSFSDFVQAHVNCPVIIVKE
ncbi:hypothetical protein BGW37DRAFT_491715 [Umbelopsis sp. PMI_123]|nr:hypothetical protein BGW37DRAFT_491715 [Umbelopsis sp. PMI_123]